jgi:putative membrane protein
MDFFLEAAAGPIQKALQTAEERETAERKAKEQESQPREDATMKTAAALARTFAGRELTHEQKKAGGPIVHYAFGALIGGIYGACAERSDDVRSGVGTAFGAALFTGADLIAVPALELAPTSTEISALAAPFAAHLVYGATTEIVRGLVRAAL